MLHSAPHIDGDPAFSCSVGRPAAHALWPAPSSTVTPCCSFLCSTALTRCFLPLLLLYGLLHLKAWASPRPCVATAPLATSEPLRPLRK